MSVFRFGAFESDVRAGELRKAGARVKLQEQPWQVLIALLENAGEIVTREELRERLWPTDTFVDFDHSLNIAINKIRDALEDVAARPRFIETVPRRGYRFIAPVERTARLQPVQPAPPPGGARWTRINRLAVGGAALLVLAVAGFAARTLIVRTTPPPGPHAIVVLPLRNLSAEPDTDYFSDGLTDQIIYNLSILEGLAVKSRTSSFQFKSKADSVRDIGRQLQADLVLEGTVLRAAGRLRLTIALVRVADDVTVWSGRYDREMADVFEIQDEISRSIANELRLKGVAGQRHYNTNLEAYDVYLQAIALSSDNSPGAGQSRGRQLERAIELFRQVTTKDQQFAPAFAGAAESWANLRNRGRSRESTEWMREAAARAIELDPLLPDAHATLGLVHASDLQWQNAEADFRRALELNPNSARTRADFAKFVLLPEGRTEEALVELRKAEKLDPMPASRRIELAGALLRAGDYGTALALTGPIFAADPSDYFAGQLQARALMLQGKLSQAVAILEKLPKESGSHQYLGRAYAILGRRREAEALAAEPDPASPRYQLVIYTALGDRERAFAALQAMVNVNDWAADWYPGDPELASLRDDPRMREFRRQRGLTAEP